MGPALLLAAALGAAPDPSAALPGEASAAAAAGELRATALPGQRRRTHGRLVLAAEAGGGWASDAYLGAGLGGSSLLELSPSARLDLSFSPRLKAAAGASATLARLPGDDFGSAGGAAGAELRVVGRSAEGALGLAGDTTSYSRPAPLLGGAGPGVTATAGLAATPALRLRAGPVGVRLSATGELRRSRVDGESVDEHGLAAVAGVGGPAGRWLALDASVRGERVASAHPDFARGSAGASALAVAAPLDGGPTFSLSLSGQSTRYDTARREALLRADVEVAQPIGPVVLLVSWGGSRSRATGGGSPDRDASRQAILLGVRGRREVLAW